MHNVLLWSTFVWEAAQDTRSTLIMNMHPDPQAASCLRRWQYQVLDAADYQIKAMKKNQKRQLMAAVCFGSFETRLMRADCHLTQERVAHLLTWPCRVVKNLMKIICLSQSSTPIAYVQADNATQAENVGLSELSRHRRQFLQHHVIHSFTSFSFVLPLLAGVRKPSGALQGLGSGPFCTRLVCSSGPWHAQGVHHQHHIIHQTRLPSVPLTPNFTTAAT
jgi:hypothetical protein